jgi:HSP20 family molecular chaperone IbpA
MSTANIKDLERLNSQQLESLKRRQFREIKSLEDNHQNYKAEIKKSQANDIVELQDENQRQLARETEKKERVLTEMKTNLQNTQKMTDKQLKALQNEASQERNQIQDKLGLDREKITQDNQLYLGELNDRFQVETRKINQQGSTRINEMTTNMNEKYAEQQGHLQKKVNDQSIDFTKKFNRQAKEQQILKDQVDQQNKHQRLSTNQRQQSEMAKLTETHNHFIEKKDIEYRRGLKEQDAFFEQRYATNFESHSKDANNLDERYNNLMNKLKTDLSREMTKSEQRLEDPFYQFTELRPTWQHTEDGVEIKVAVPEYSKQDLQLTTNNKEALLNFNRRYTDNNTSEDGISNKVSKIETFTAKIQTDIALNPKSVKSSYQDGVMTYIIKKA